MGRTPDDTQISVALLALAAERGPGDSFCPSEVARALAADWRALMPDIRRVAARLQDKGQLHATQKGQLVRADTARGPIRLGLSSGQGGADC